MSGPEIIRADEPLHPYTSLHVGGRARYFAEPASCDEVLSALSFALSEGVPWSLLGAGTNVLFRDDPYPELVVRTTSLRGLWLDERRLRCGAGESLAAVAHAAEEAGLSGLEWACGIPGTVGGAVNMNAGAHGCSMADVLDEAISVAPDGTFHWSVDELGFGYRESRFRTVGSLDVVTEATFELARSTPAAVRAQGRAYLARRRSSQPQGASAGCIFRNPDDAPPAGALLDRAGCKGLRVGEAHVSTVHANFILNEGRRNAEDILTLIERMTSRVRNAFGIDLVEEIVIR